MITKRLELRNLNDKIVFGRTMSYDERYYEIGDVVKRFFELAYNNLTDECVAKSRLVIKEHFGN